MNRRTISVDLRPSAGLLLLLLLTSLLLGSGCRERTTAAKSSGDASAEAQAAAEEAKPEEKTEKLTEVRPLTLWKLSKEGQEDSYLFGTCHAGLPLNTAISREGLQSLKASKRFVMEMDIKEVMENPSAMLEGLLLPGGQLLSHLLGDEDWLGTIETFELGPAADVFETLHPFALLAFIAQKLSSELFDVSAATPMDLEAANLASEAGIEPSYLETLNQQLEIFLGAPMEEMLDGIRELRTAEGQQNMRDELRAVLDICRTGNLQSASSILAELDESDWGQTLLKRRNENWAPMLDAWFQEGQTFVAAGAGHMLGKFSVLGLMEERGYTVEQMSGQTQAAGLVANASE